MTDSPELQAAMAFDEAHPPAPGEMSATEAQSYTGMDEALDAAITELVAAACPFADVGEPDESWPCHIYQRRGLAGCGQCQRVLRLRRALRTLGVSPRW